MCESQNLVCAAHAHTHTHTHTHHLSALQELYGKKTHRLTPQV